jgi:hypothetical protein
MALLANLMSDRKKHPQAFTPSDFLPDWQGAAAAPSDEELLAKVMGINATMGGQVRTS